MVLRPLSAFLWATGLLFFGGASFAMVYSGSVNKNVTYDMPPDIARTSSETMLKRQLFMDALKAAAQSSDPIYLPKKTKD